jgi:UDP-glucose 4-epimerase
LWGVDYWFESDITHEALKVLNYKGGRPDAIFHAAGGSSVGQSVVDPLRDFDRTVRTTAVFLDAVHKLASDTLMILPSSAAVYGIAGPGPINEQAPLAPVSPYGIHKCLTEQLVRGANQLFGLRYAIIRYFSVYGPGLQKQLLWDLAQKLSSSQKEIVLFGTGEETRDFFHVEDAALFALMVAEKMGERDPLIVNGGSGESVSVRYIAETLGSLLSPETAIRFNGIQRAGDPFHYQADIQLMDGFGFRPTWRLDKGMAGYVDWLAQSDSGDRKCA